MMQRRNKGPTERGKRERTSTEKTTGRRGREGIRTTAACLPKLRGGFDASKLVNAFLA
jgi:hypothetical protein